MATITEFYNLSINMYCNKKDDITVDYCFDELFKSTLIVDRLTDEEQKWFFTGFSKKEASKYLVFNNKKPTNYAYKHLEKEYKKNNASITQSIWNNKPDGFSCSISYFMKSIANPKSLNLIIKTDQRPKNMDFLLDSITILSKDNDKSWIIVSSKGYWLKGRNVFPDRMCVGWMLYLPHIILAELVPEAARVIPVLDEGKQRGTIIVTTEELFDGAKKEHIEKANDIEIRLLDLGMLPLMTEI